MTSILKTSTLDPSVLGSCRPISNLPFISKVLEWAVNERMLLRLHSNGLLPESAYRRSHSTETALLKVTADALIAADMGKLTLLGMLDLSAAFDCADHSILLGRLEVSFGFGGTVLDWMSSYLVGRRQYVRYNGLTSSTTVVQFGVPPGASFGGRGWGGGATAPQGKRKKEKKEGRKLRITSNYYRRPPPQGKKKKRRREGKNNVKLLHIKIKLRRLPPSN